MNDAKYIELAARYLSGNINAKERRELMEWVAESDANQAFFDEMIHIWGVTGDADQLFEADTEQAWSKVVNRINSRDERILAEAIEKEEAPREAKIRTLSIKRILLRVAAVILPLVALSTWWLLQKSPIEVLIYSSDTIKEVQLPDGSLVSLNKNSQLTYWEDFKERKVTLAGEAFFDIARDTLNPFEIYSDQTVTRVLGTSFNVRAYPNEEKVEVTVSTGRVEFQEQEDSKDKVILTADQAAVFVKKEKEVKEVVGLKQNATAWKNKVIDADDIPLEQFLETLNNYFDKSITVENPVILSCRTTLPDFRDPELDDILLMLEEFMDVQVDSTGGKIILEGMACK